METTKQAEYQNTENGRGMQRGKVHIGLHCIFSPELRSWERKEGAYLIDIHCFLFFGQLIV